jgi:hypothetical protein
MTDTELRAFDLASPESLARLRAAMAAKLKMFHGDGLFVPRPWLEALGLKPHVRQVPVTVFARSKSDVAAMLTDRGLFQGSADRMASEMRLAKHVSTPDAALIEAGVISTSGPGIYACGGFVKDHPVIRVEPDGSCSVVAHFRASHRNGPLVVEKED